MENNWDIIHEFYDNMKYGDKIRIDNSIYMKPEKFCNLENLLISLTNGELYHFSRIIKPDTFNEIKEVPDIMSINIY